MTTPRDAVPIPGAIDISISPVWTIRHHGERQFDLLLLTLLQAIQETGRLTDAAQRARISYRHAWNVIDQWGSFFRSPANFQEHG